MMGLHDLHAHTPILAAFTDATIIAVTLIVALSVWILPQYRKDQQKEANKAEFLQTLINAIPAPIFYKDENGIYTGCNAEFEQYIGRESKDIIGQTVYGLAPEELAKVYHNADMVLMHSGENQIYEARVKHADGTEHDVMFHKAIYHNSNGDIGGIIGVILDITERKELERRLKSLATLDDLTQIPNRREFDHRVEQALLKNQRYNERIALLFIDMDGFKDVNDRFGHEAGDRVLKEAADRLTGLIRKSDVVGRIGGDEYAILLDRKVTVDSVSTVAKKLLKSLSDPFPVNGNDRVQLSASIGIAFSPEDGDDIQQLLAQADEAMYASKNIGKNTFTFASELSAGNQTNDA